MTLAPVLRRAAAVACAVLALAASVALLGGQAPALPTVTVYKSPTCGCCGKWIDHVKAAGFTVVAHDMEDLSAVRGRYGVPFRLGSCHTARVGGYVIEGHVPADLIQKLLADRPALVGLAVPGMVTGSPGMDGPNPVPYDVVAWDRSGKTTVYARR